MERYINLTPTPAKIPIQNAILLFNQDYCPYRAIQTILRGLEAGSYSTVSYPYKFLRH